MRESDATEPRIAALASRQGGVVGIAQLLDAGLDHRAVARRVAAGRLHPLYRGVYAVGHRSLAVTGRRWAAVLACGPGAALSHGSAGVAWEIVRSGGELHVLVGLGGRTAPDGIRLHRSRVIAPADVTTLHGLPITTPARTLLDLAATLTPTRLSTAVSRAEQQRLLDFADLHELLQRHPHRPGSPALRAVLATYTGPRDTRSALEDLIAELDITPPQINTVIEHGVRDFAWPDRRLVVEADSYTWHRSPAALNTDRERDVTLALAGWRTLRFTYAHVTQRPDYVAGAITTALGG